VRELSDAAATLHRLTRHGSVLDAADRARLVAFQPLDPSNRPTPFKRYLGHDPVLLPRDFAWSSARGVDALAGRTTGAVDWPWNAATLARLLFFSNGVSRTSGSAFGDTSYFRTAMSAGNLHPVEIYVVCGSLEGVPAGVYHFAPLEFGLVELRRGDYRVALARAALDPRIAETLVTLVLTGIPWRTAWKYGERGFRHLFWDAGAILANLLALAPASVDVGFVDELVAQLIGIDGDDEFPLALAVLPGPHPIGNEDGHAGVVDVPRLDPVVEPISRAPLTFPLITAAQRDGNLADARAVERWRSTATLLGTPTAVAVEPPAHASDDPIEAVILRRGSTRLMRREAVPRDLLTWGLGAATRAVPSDFTSESATLLEHFVSVHEVEGVAPGAYRLRGRALEQGRVGQQRDLAAHLCLDQPLGGDSAYTVFHSAALDEVLNALGARGYRAAQLEAGIASGRLALVAFALGYGATGLTFYDDEVSRAFGTTAACMLVTSVGVPEYRNTPGGSPAQPTPLRHFDRLMERLSLQLYRRGS
jgi:SagB-type dehydrogenase family enzyme